MPLGSGVGISYREIIECRYIGLFSILKSISYLTSHIKYLDILKTSVFFCFFSPKILKTHEPKSSTTTTITPKIPKICQKYLKKKVFFEALISYRYRILSRKNSHIVSISYWVEKKLIAQGCSEHTLNTLWQNLKNISHLIALQHGVKRC